jgi:hypothetical protein
MKTYNEWDDGILESKRVLAIFRGHRREFDFKFWSNGSKGGDFETLCKSVAHTLQFYSKEYGNYEVLRKTLAHESDICKQLAPHDTPLDFCENVAIQYDDIFGVTDITLVIAYAIIAKEVGVSTYDIVREFHHDIPKLVAKEVCVSFDNLQYTCYNKTTVDEYQLQEIINTGK